MKSKILNLNNQEVGEIELDQSIFGLPLRKDILHRVIEWQRAKKRAGTHKTKGISEISGTTKKPYKQKGTGNARQGSTRSAQFRGGATIFGPVVRSHAYDLPKKVRKLGLKIALSAKLAEGKLIILENIEIEELKTSLLHKNISLFSLKNVLIIDGDQINDNFKKASANIVGLDLLPQKGANVYDIVKHDALILTNKAIEELTERLK
ncbi:MAG: 50S ribosomal protein L4 [Alphaproteobacteria bacterium]